MIDLETNNKLFQSAFDTSIWKNSDKISYLKENINSIERSIRGYLENITTDFSQLTDHSLVHSRMLWNYASIIIGDSSKFLNPLEAFVLHIAFLIHDSGMCYSILNNMTEIQKDPLYLDFVKRNGNSDKSQKDALFYVVRFRHGDYALRVAIEKLSNDEYLINDIALREELGLLIGKIAKSHTCNINYIEREFGARYCPPNFPTDWSIDCQKLSFILRTADAAHLDNLRTPKSNKLISEIEGISKDHWTFQKKLGFPTLSHDSLLIYSTNTPFTEKEQKAWWFCHEALIVLDRELRTANEFFEIKKQDCFNAKGVKSINDTLDLGKKYIRTDGWTSIDTNIKVTNPVHIATELGGIKLYGNINIALRELIQNSIDAINLYRIHTGQENYGVGEIQVSIEKDEDVYFLIITDNGIGMSQTLLSNELLDFGGSYWKSNKFKLDFEGAQNKGFESIGKFGIGFFSVFMLGQIINVTSWKFGESIDNMKTLDFYDGTNSNPILRNPSSCEKHRIIDRGTSVKIKLDIDPYSKEGFIGNSSFVDNKLYTLIKFFIPAANVKITTKESDGTINTIPPKYLMNLDIKKMFDFVYLPRKNQLQDGLIELFKSINIQLIEINDNGALIGKLVMLPSINNHSISSAITISNGIRIKELGAFVGYINTNDIISVKRDSFSKIVSYENIKEWAIKQKKMIEELNLKRLYSFKYFGLLMTFGMHDDSLPILLKKADNNYSFVTINDFRNNLKNCSEFKVYREGHTFAGRLPNCDGYIELNYGFSVNEIVKDDDLDKIIQHKDLIKNIITEEWGGFEQVEDNLLKAGYNLDMPYMFIETFKKPSP
ncbi:HD domain-containing protein [Ancylomarina sp. YFZ004]